MPRATTKKALITNGRECTVRRRSAPVPGRSNERTTRCFGRYRRSELAKLAALGTGALRRIRRTLPWTICKLVRGLTEFEASLDSKVHAG